MVVKIIFFKSFQYFHYFAITGIFPWTQALSFNCTYSVEFPLTKDALWPFVCPLILEENFLQSDRPTYDKWSEKLAWAFSLGELKTHKYSLFSWYVNKKLNVRSLFKINGRSRTRVVFIPFQWIWRQCIKHPSFRR